MEDINTTDWMDAPFVKSMEDIMGKEITLVGFREFKDKDYDIDKVMYSILLPDGSKAKFSSAGKYLKAAALAYKEQLPMKTTLIKGDKARKGRNPPWFFKGLFMSKAPGDVTITS
jgi:hypothetical protein